jgi:hypothetical protein
LLFSRIGYWSNWVAGLLAFIIIVATFIGFLPLTGFIATNILCAAINLLFVHVMNKQVEEQKECIMICDEILGKL